jgi:hypothetical protein
MAQEVRRVAAALGVLLAWLVDRVVDVQGQLGQLLDIVLQRDGEPVRVGEVPEARVCKELIRGSEREARAVRVPAHGIPLDESVVVSTTSRCVFNAIEVPRAGVT